MKLTNGARTFQSAATPRRPPAQFCQCSHPMVCRTLLRTGKSALRLASAAIHHSAPKPACDFVSGSSPPGDIRPARVPFRFARDAVIEGLPWRRERPLKIFDVTIAKERREYCPATIIMPKAAGIIDVSVA